MSQIPNKNRKRFDMNYKHSSMEQPTRKGVMVEYPTSPNPTEETVHPFHSQHPLMEVTVSDLFTCNACKEKGSGRRFSCQHCDFQLHDFCALAPPALTSHPLHAQHQLSLSYKPKSGVILWQRCDICDKPTKGFSFRCSACHFQMHPCCAMLSGEMNLSTHPHKLSILPPFSANDAVSPCAECRRQRSGRIYRCPTCNYHLHAVCAKNMLNGLQDNGINTSSKPSMIGPTARVASQFVIHFISGLVDGVGQSVGQALVQEMSKGDCRSTRGRISG